MPKKKKTRGIKYPKFLLLIATFAISYFMFRERAYLPFHEFIISFGYAGIFIAGMLYAFGFTAAPASVIFLILAENQNILLASLIGAAGTFFSDMLIFRFVRHYFKEEIKKLSNEKIVMYFVNTIPKKLIKYIVPVFAGFIIASPFPDEIGVTLLASTTKLSERNFAIIDFGCNMAGILTILMIGRAVF